MMKKVFSLLLALMLMISMVPAALAAEVGSTIIVKGKDLFGFEIVSEYTDTDLFDNFKDVMPGDRLDETVTITNQLWGYDYIKVYMRAVPHHEQFNPLTYSEPFENEDGKDQADIDGVRDETVATMTDFLSQLTMRVYDKNGRKIYEASPDELDGLKNNVYLGTLRRLRSMELRVELDVPAELGNEYANRVGEVDWVFTIEGHNDPSDNPKTGDYIITFAVAAMVISAAALAVLLLLKKRNRKA